MKQFNAFKKKHKFDRHMDIEALKRRLENIKQIKQRTSKISIQQWLWYLGHVYTTVASGLLFILSILFDYNGRPTRLLYRSIFMVVISTYWLSLMRMLDGQRPPFSNLLHLDTAQYLLLAILWLFTPQHNLKVLPFWLYALLQSLDFCDKHFSITGETNAKIKGALEKIAPPIVLGVAYIDYFMFVVLIWDALLIRPGAMFALLGYIIFYRARLMFQKLPQQVVNTVWHEVDQQLSRDDTPEFLANLWRQIKDRIINHSAYIRQSSNQKLQEEIQKANVGKT